MMPYKINYLYSSEKLSIADSVESQKSDSLLGFWKIWSVVWKFRGLQGSGWWEGKMCCGSD